ncbi:MAG: hypothetical protein BroJett011_74800 [Chloroflexota bacterium]|nr:MAG: hypothetical protein BroJett011_74800 [Chloroflexota bacterium]
MKTQKQPDLVITPVTWPQQADSLRKTSTGLLHAVGWFGSTHSSAMWRKANEFLAVFQDRQIPGFDPQLEGVWDPSFAVTEAQVMATADVIVIRLENNELLNGSLGSIAETGLALTSAALRGQFVIISIEDNLITSLNEPDAIAMYMVMETALEKLAKVDHLACYFRIHRGDDLQELAALACDAAQQQMAAPLKSLKFSDFLAKKHKRQQRMPLRMLVGGSGGPYTKPQCTTFYAKRKLLADSYCNDDHIIKDLAAGAFAEAWSIPFDNTDNTALALAMRTLLLIELETMQEADLLLMPIATDVASVAPATKIGFLLLSALTTGQDLKIYLEPFDPIDYIQQHLNETHIDSNPPENAMRKTLQSVGISDAALAVAEQAEVAETFEIIKAIITPCREKPDFKQVKKSLLGQTRILNRADNIRRVRALVQAHLEKLQADQHYRDFFSLVVGFITPPVGNDGQ